MKKALVILAAIVMLFSTIALGCGGKSAISGKYISEDNPEQYLLLQKDGTFIDKGGVSGGGDITMGEWTVSDSTLLLVWTGVARGVSAESQIRENKIIIFGQVFVKK